MTGATDRLIGVVGATGAVGGAAVHRLRALGYTRLLLGGRRPEPLAAFAARLGGDAGARRADADSPESLSAFCDGCDVVLNCAGPSYRIADAVAVAALAAGADYVDVTGDGPAHDRLSRTPAARDSAIVLSAGVLPGLSALLPRWFAARYGLERMSVHAGGLERCTEAAAGDLLLSLPGAEDPAAVFGEPLAAWRDGRVVARALRAADGVRVPGFPGTAFVQPFLTGEARRLAAVLRLRGLEWYNVHPGERTRAVLTSFAGRPGADPEDAAARLRRAADLDLAGRTPYYRLVYALTGPSGDRRTMTVGLPDSYRMTGRVGAQAVDAVARGLVPRGLHHAADVLDPASTVAALFDDPSEGTLRVEDTRPDSSEDEEGHL
ncbi:saccharopine dehydrogenase NADP-binding domain-containing protein [Nocardiopsis sp. CT-R113]|uniref:Saccharopine dehydrogenase NADP-binding domain-containing protein n=1 Tax=Nocardiopsis codii TaxID=3065942 RepID=A0ABU7KDF9_9ACTN|nr:saccharopine dehydrogenase NADP-binding domain-containing protein [Nocardiopsis sp. CT-R113]MEE2039944.1 saccharopine dehydrogenase NADP-binding domain-containing protein [Nocardiopsis sp. CT-R113]